MTFDMSNPHHVEALALFSAQSDRGRSEFVINCILQARQENRLESIIRQTISETLAGIYFADREPLPEKEVALTDDISDLPGALLSIMEEI